MFKNKVAHWLRIVEASPKRRFRHWSEDEWFQNLLDQVTRGLRLVQTFDADLNRLEYFMATALDAQLNYWEDPPTSIYFTYRGIRLSAFPSTRRIGATRCRTTRLANSEGRAHGSSGIYATGCCIKFKACCGRYRITRLDSGQEREQHVGGYRQAPREDANLGEPNLFEGRTGARIERDVRAKIRIYLVMDDHHQN